MTKFAAAFAHWRGSLLYFQQWFERRRAETQFFLPKVFLAFVGINLLCFWWALLTAYPWLLFGHKKLEFVLTGFPVAILGAMFDSLSLFVTLILIDRALSAKSNISYVGYLSVDLFIAVLATFWVLFAFMFSGWIVSLVLQNPETMSDRTGLYQSRLANVLENPFSRESLRNMYFGMIMGASALLPTLFHMGMAARSVQRSVADAIKLKRSGSA